MAANKAPDTPDTDTHTHTHTPLPTRIFCGINKSLPVANTKTPCSALPAHRRPALCRPPTLPVTVTVEAITLYCCSSDHSVSFVPRCVLTEAIPRLSNRGFVQWLSSNKASFPDWKSGWVILQFHYGAIYSFQRSEHNAEQQAHGNSYNTPGVCGQSYHLIKEFAGAIHAAGQAS